MWNGYFNNIILSMFDWPDQGFESFFDQTYESFENQQEKLSYLIEKYDNYLDTNLQSTFARSDQIFEAKYAWYDIILEKNMEN